jgi:allophanate hydrolase subunit 2
VPVGAIEVPPSNELLVLQRGRPVTAGYPVIAVANRTAQSALGQVRPGDVVRFQRTTIDQAVTAHRKQQRAVDALAQRVRTAFGQLGITTAEHAAEATKTTERTLR